LVTGATGGLGRSLVPLLLEQGYQVVATGRDPGKGAELEKIGARFVAAELRDDVSGLVCGVDTVFHLAALSSPWGRRRDFEDINITATQKLLTAARQSGCSRFVHASTPSVYTEARHRLGLTEDSRVATPFANHYAATKYKAEQLVRQAHGGALQTIALRPRAIVGPHDQVLLPRLLPFIRAGIMPMPGGGNALVEMTDARDVAAAFLAADRCAGLAGQVVNISGGAPRTVRQLVTAICDKLGARCRLIPVSAALAMPWANLAEGLGHITGREPRLTRYSVMTLGWSQTFDLKLAHSLLDWRPRFSPEDAILHALAHHA
jgi:nucleoside-diphosphate-sugar epimerase